MLVLQSQQLVRRLARRLPVVFLLGAAACVHAAPIRFHTERAGFVSLNVYRADGALEQRLLEGAPFAAGDHEAQWPGGPALPRGWSCRAIFREALGLRVIGRIGDFGGDRGPSTAAAADDARVYLGWALATANADAVVACSPSGAIQWTHRRGALSGCRALAADAGMVYVLGGEGAAGAEGRGIYRLDAVTGAMIPWPDGRTDLKIVSLWPPKGDYKPDLASNMAVKNGRIYLSFSQGQFIAVLDARSGHYLQTIVGAAPGAIDAVPTRADAPDKPGALLDADFVVAALKSGAIGKMLLAHDPIWLLASELTPMEEGRRINAVAMIGDGAPHHARDIFVGLNRPWDQVEARPALATDTFDYVAGQPGGPVEQGVWQPERMGDIRGIALDPAGQLWVAEGDAIPSRISVWSTDGPAGRLLREFFAPPDAASPVALDPLDPAVVIAGGCEWRIDPATGRAECTGVVTQQIFTRARFAMEEDHLLLVLTPATGPDVVLERAGAGDYRPRSAAPPPAVPEAFQLLRGPSGEWRIVTADGFDLGALPDAAGELGSSGSPVIARLADGRVFIAARKTRVAVMELTGIASAQPLPVTAGP